MSRGDTDTGPRVAAASRGDFHCHSTASDGRLTPAEVVRLAAARGVTVLALTDHDTTAGLAEASAAAVDTGLQLIPGVELACDLPGNELHMLGLFIDPEAPALQARMRGMREERVERGRRTTEALAGLGAPVPWARVQAIAGEASVGRPHVARALLEAGHVASIEEAFDRFLARGQPAYVERERLEPAEAIALVRGAGGLPVFAHPPFTDDYAALAAEFADIGLWGLEVYYGAYPADQVEALRHLAERLGLAATGGSDFHAPDRQNERMPGEIPFPTAAVDAMLAAARRAGAHVPDA
ncbi:MAG: PHP domain-containing protein [Chloroflexi bacterium]|nr:PHP domain-containing protein [Chloroflexota bacterium]